MHHIFGALLSTSYSHKGWTGEAYASDFEAKWGLVKLSEMHVARPGTSLSVAVGEARAAGFEYLIADTPSAHNNRLYRLTATNVKCVVATLAYQERKMKKSHDWYHSGIEARSTQILRAIKSRARTYSLDEAEIKRRITAGVCEATGMRLDLETVGSPFGPSIDQVEPGAGYTMENSRVVCVFFNRMKGASTEAEVIEFVRHLRSEECAFAR